MPVAWLDTYHAGIALTDIPVGYTPAVGRDMHFPVSYYQRLDSQPATLNFSNLGPQWQIGWLSYIEGGPTNNETQAYHHEANGSVKTYSNYFANAAQGLGAQIVNEGDFLDNQAHNQATLHYRQNPERYERWLPDGTIETFAQSVGTNPSRLFFLTAITDPRGNVTQLKYDPVAAGNGQAVLKSIVDPFGNSLQLSYDNAADPLKITRVTRSLDGLFARFQYTNGQLSSITDTQGITSTFQYLSDSTDMASMTTPYGTTTFHSSVSAGYQEADMTNPLGQTERAEFVSTLDPSVYPASEPKVPSAPGLIINNVNLNQNNSFYWNRRAMDEVKKTGAAVDSAAFYALARVSHWASGDQGPIPIPMSTKAPLENRVWYNYQGQPTPDYIDLTSPGTTTLVSATARVLDDGSTQATLNTYNSIGFKTQSVDPLGRTTNYTYAANNIDVIQASRVNGSNNDVLLSATYNNQHLPLTVTDAAGQTSTLTYNTAGQVLTSTNAKGETTTFTYNLDGTVKLVTRPAAGATTTFAYDNAQRVQTITDSEGEPINFAYDNLDRLIKTTHLDGTADLVFYDNPASPLDVSRTVDRQNRTTTYQYDAIRELIKTTDAKGGITQYGWCSCGGLASLTDANKNVTTWSRDILGRITAKIMPDGTQTQMTFEATTSRLHQMQDANGNIAVYSYNVDNTLSGTVYTPGPHISATPNVSLTYDPAYTRALTMTDGVGTTTYAYNPVNGQLGANQLASITQPIYGTNQSATVAYQYDQLGRVISQSVDGATTNANTETTSYDSLGRVTNVSNPLGAFTYAYVRATNRLDTITLPNWQKTVFSYFDNTGDQRLKEINNYVFGLISNRPVSDFQYTYNPVGTIATWQQQADNNPATQLNLGYDATDELTSAVQKDASASVVKSNAFQYDLAGNRLAETTLAGTTAGQFNGLNQLTSFNVNPPVQTVAGHTTQPAQNVSVNAVPATITQSTNFVASVPLPNGTNVVTISAQDSSGAITTQRTQVVTSGSSTGTTSALFYDANGNTGVDENGNRYTWDALNRMTAINYARGGQSQFVYDGLSRRVAIIEKDATGATTSTKLFLWIGQTLAEERDVANNVTKRFFAQGEQQAGVNYFYTRDHLGSVRELVDSNDNIVARYDYDPYGRTTLVQGTNLADFQYAGYYAHQPSGLNFTLFRAYDPNTGRWLSRDPIAEQGGINLYGYVGNEPMYWIDRLGLDPIVAKGIAKVDDDGSGSNHGDFYHRPTTSLKHPDGTSLTVC